MFEEERTILYGEVENQHVQVFGIIPPYPAHQTSQMREEPRNIFPSPLQSLTWV